jgi:hypothetical protein
MLVRIEPLLRLVLTAPAHGMLLLWAYFKVGGLGREERREIDRWLGRLPFRRITGGSP